MGKTKFDDSGDMGHQISDALFLNESLLRTLLGLLQQVISQLHIDAAAILIKEPNEHTLKFICGKGFHTRALKHTNLRFGEGLAGRAALERRMVKAYNLIDKQHEIYRSPLFAEEGFVAYWGMPLLVKGVLEVYSREPAVPNQDWLDFLEVLAGQAAIAIDNAELYNNLQRSNTELFLAYDNTLEGWASALELRDKETEGHARRVTDITNRLAKQIGIQDKDMIYVRWGARLHDIGKMAIPDDILLKSGKLTEEEWDGTSYPRGLKGDEIPLEARIFAVIDVWDALSSDRPFRKAWSQEKIIDYVREQSGSHFDPDIVEAFLELIAKMDGGSIA